MHYRDTPREIDGALLARVCSEYIDMPGLRLTLPQASRLWNMNLATSARVLERLVDASFLCRRGDCYVRADSPRMCA